MSGLRDVFDLAYRQKKCELDHFVFGGIAGGQALAGAAGAQAVIPVQFTNDSDFLWEAFSFISMSAAGVVVALPDYLISFQDTGSGRYLQDVPIHITNISGNGQWPFVLPEAKIFRGSATCIITVTNNTAVASTVYPAMIGRKVFYNRGYDRDAIIYGV